MKFEEIPQNIRDSLFSERVNEILEEVREKACITSPGLIARALYNLIAKETPAHYFVESLAETGIGNKIAASVAKAIKERILESERYPLFRWGIDISEIKVNDAEDVEKLGLKEDLEPKEDEKTIHLESLDEAETKPETIPILKNKEVPPEVKKEEAASPFILQEKPKEERVAGGRFSGRIIPSLSMGFFKSKKPAAAYQPKTIRAEVETPSSPSNTKRVVHYSESRSDLAPFEPGGEFLRTEEITPMVRPVGNDSPKNLSSARDTSGIPSKIKPVEQPPQTTPKPEKPALPETEKAAPPKPFVNTILKKQAAPQKGKEPAREKGPNLEGNTIDLRSK